MSIGLKELAEKAGVSMMTASRAVRNSKGVGEKTRKRILKLADELGYVPHRVASNLAQRCTFTIGVVVPTLERFFPQAVMGAEKLLETKNYHLFLSCSNNDVKHELRQVRALLERRVDGIIFSPVSTTGSKKALKLINTNNCPVVLMDRCIPGVKANSITFADKDGGFSITNHLLENDYSPVAHISGPDDNWIARRRKEGYIQALETHGFCLDEKYCAAGDLTFESGYQNMLKFLDMEVKPRSVFCVNDLTALGAFQALKERGVAIPDEVALAGFGTMLETDLLDPSLTMIEQDANLLGAECARALVDMLENGGGDYGQKVLPVSLKVRNST